MGRGGGVRGPIPCVDRQQMDRRGLRCRSLGRGSCRRASSIRAGPRAEPVDRPRVAFHFSTELRGVELAVGLSIGGRIPRGLAASLDSRVARVRSHDRRLASRHARPPPRQQAPVHEVQIRPHRPRRWCRLPRVRRGPSPLLTVPDLRSPFAPFAVSAFLHATKGTRREESDGGNRRGEEE